MGKGKGNWEANITKHQWKKGESGNPNGAPKKLPELNELMALVLGDDEKGKTYAEAMLIAQRKKAVKGDTRAFEALFDRGYGKPSQRNEGGNETQETQVFKIGDQVIKF